MRNFLLFLSFLTFYNAVSAQNITGIWRGYFKSSSGETYRLEFQIEQPSQKNMLVRGVSYSWQDDIRFYGKATMTGVRVNDTLKIREIKTVEVRSSQGGTCIMNYNLVYAKSGKEEFLEGSYLGKSETPGQQNPYEWGQCGGGTVVLRRVATTDFYMEPFLKQPVTNRPTPKQHTPKETTKDTTPRTTKPATGNTTKPTTVLPQKQEEKVDVIITDVPKIEKPAIIKIPLPEAPSIIKNRQKNVVETITVSSPDIKIKLYDNGEIDDDTISVYANHRVILDKKRLSDKALEVSLKLDEVNDEIELVMVAENLGRIPPNTSLMIIEAGKQRYRVQISSNLQKSAAVKVRYKPD